MAQEEGLQVWEELQEELQRPLQACNNKCYCKKCCYHCPLCFTQKGLGIAYYVPRTRRTVKKIQNNQVPIHNQSTWTRNSQAEKKSQTKVGQAATADHTPGRKNS
uniref:Protein Tat n=1 Tax=Simian immunodeficiency virus TaxID=11723 RepID=A0A2P1DQ03_SIV|nr:tat protein [Simian-Human immunodeficiency virus]AVK70362.1 tat protein [Simian-Human immunodeficiency virus]AVK70371.1 tat protein [Simian immunodeficiency virus]